MADVSKTVAIIFEGQDKTIRMDQKPGERLPVIDGQVVTQTASVDAPGQG